MKIINTVFNFTLLFQFILTLVFISDNINNLESIQYSFTILTTDYDFSMNLYALLGVISVVFLAIILTSIQIVGSGVNDYGSSSVAKYISYILIFTLLSIPTTYYFANLENYFIIIELIIAFVYLLRVLSNTSEIDSTSTD